MANNVSSRRRANMPGWSSAKLQSDFIASIESDVSTVTLQRVSRRASVGTSLRTITTLVSPSSVSRDWTAPASRFEGAVSNVTMAFDPCRISPATFEGNFARTSLSEMRCAFAVDGAWDAYRSHVKAAAIVAKRRMPTTTDRPWLFFSVRSIELAERVSLP